VEADRFRAHDYKQITFSAAGVGTTNRGDPALADDHLPGRHAWVASTRWAPLHGPTTEWHVRAGTPAPVLEPPSILVHASAGGATPSLALRTAAGEFRVRPDALGYFQPEEFLSGGARVERVPPTVMAAPDHADGGPGSRKVLGASAPGSRRSGPGGRTRPPTTSCSTSVSRAPTAST
jgi:hypothetical protein